MKKVPVYIWLFLVSTVVIFLPASVQMAMTAGPDMFSYRLITYQFVHAGTGHLLGNFLLGMPSALYLERRLGKKRFLSFFLLAGIGSALWFLLGMVVGNLAGSSGSIFGVFAYSLILWAREGRWQQAMAILLAVFMIAPEISASMNFSFDSVAHAGHVGGVVAAPSLTNYIKPIKRIVIREKPSH